MKQLPLEVYRVLAALKSEGVATHSAVADVLDLEVQEALVALQSLAWLGWSEEQKLFDGSSEFSLSPSGAEVLLTSPLRLNAEGHRVMEPPVFKDTTPPIYKQDTLF